MWYHPNTVLVPSRLSVQVLCAQQHLHVYLSSRGGKLGQGGSKQVIKMCEMEPAQDVAVEDRAQWPGLGGWSQP